jgi:hypothetical protein
MKFEFEITGSCRGCPKPVLFEDSINRNRSPVRVLEFDVKNRPLLTTCTCPAGVEGRGLGQRILFMHIRSGYLENLL